MKKHLMEIYDNTSSLFDPETILDGLREIIVETKMNYREKIITNRSKLVSEECPIVVAGTLTLICAVDFSVHIKWTSPFPNLVVPGVRFHFYFISNRKSCK